MATTEEAKVKKSICEYLKTLDLNGHPIYFERREAGGFSYKEGLPDLWCIYDGIHIEIELKQPTGSTRARQEKWEREFRRKGVLYIRPHSFKEFKEWFEDRVLNVIGRKV